MKSFLNKTGSCFFHRSQCLLSPPPPTFRMKHGGGREKPIGEQHYRIHRFRLEKIQSGGWPSTSPASKPPTCPPFGDYAGLASHIFGVKSEFGGPSQYWHKGEAFFHLLHMLHQGGFDQALTKVAGKTWVKEKSIWQEPHNTGGKGLFFSTPIIGFTAMVLQEVTSWGKGDQNGQLC